LLELNPDNANAMTELAKLAVEQTKYGMNISLGEIIVIDET